MIKNKLKIGLLIAILSVVVGVKYIHAAGVAFTPDNSTITLGSDNYTVYTGSEATSVATTSTTITVVHSSSDLPFTIASSSRYVLNNDQSLTPGCSSSLSNLAITGTMTVIITPDTSATCTVAGGGGGGGGGGGSNNNVVTTVIPVNTVNPTVVPGCSAGTMFSATTGAVCGNSTSVTSNNSSNSSMTDNSSLMMSETMMITKALTAKSSKVEVKNLQTVLNKALGMTMKVDGKFGKGTTSAIKAFQKANGLKADGVLGAKTRAKLNMVK